MAQQIRIGREADAKARGIKKAPPASICVAAPIGPLATLSVLLASERPLVVGGLGLGP